MKRPTTWAVSMGILFLDIGVRGRRYNEFLENLNSFYMLALSDWHSAYGFNRL